ncbi:DUF4229 domain-containing protein [Ornithinimicrobium cavernae]|uniref:DUF4229 domain-containing protein n=1 Tax=Ornithinimicrobium cavernae TaxID=2666047 RepID=UPI000D69025A|nr:DUF4229 domain-containing protein [Ornithinimicrobium cavernae]
MFKYSVYRIGLFLVAMLVLVLVGLEPLWAAVIAALFSMVTSFFLLAGPREEAARTIEAKVERSRARRAEKLADQRTDEEAEDDDLR